MFTALVVAFSVHVLSPQPQPDLNQDTLALLCDLATQMGRATVCDNVPNDPAMYRSFTRIYPVFRHDVCQHRSFNARRLLHAVRDAVV